MKNVANSRFTIKSWDEKPYGDGQDVPKLTRAAVTKTFTGVGQLAGKAGSFVLQRTGILENGVATESLVARAGNREAELHDPTAHAEILVLREAGRLLERHTFPDCTVYTTLWPCPMCENAMIRAKVRGVVCGARSFKYIYEVAFNPSNLPKVGPIMDEQCRDIYVQWLRRKGLNMILEYEGL